MDSERTGLRSGRPLHSDMRGIYRFAGHCVEIGSVFSRVHEMCAPYRSDGRPEYAVLTTDEDIGRERERADAQDRAEGRQPSRSSDAYLETLAVYRRLADCLLDENILLYHGSAIAVDGMGYLFSAKSGIGKSTHARLWRELLGERAVMINDDKPFLEITGEGVTVWGTPWDGKHHLSSNISAPLRAVCLLEQGAEDHIEPISAREAWPALWRQSYRPTDPEKLRRALAMVESLSKHIRLYRLRCTPDIHAARLAYETMSKGESL